MATPSLRALATLASLSIAPLSLAGCHARWVPPPLTIFVSPPPYYFRTASADGVLNRVMEGTVTDEAAGYASGFKYEIPAPGSLVITTKPANPQAQLDIEAYTDTDVPIATTKGGDKKLQIQDLTPGTLFIVVQESWREAVRSKFKVTALFKPTDPDGANGPYKTQAGAREIVLNPDRGSAGDYVDYSAMRRTNFWKITLPGDGELGVKFTKDEQAGKLTAQLIPPAGAPQPIDPTVGVALKDAAAGEYFIKVTADDAGESGKYTLSALYKGGDTCKNGGPACYLNGADELKMPSDSKQGEVDFTKAKQFHFYKFTIAPNQKGKVTIGFKINLPARGSKVACYLMRTPDEEGEKITGTSLTRALDPGDYYLRVQAPEQGEFAKYALTNSFLADNFITADVLEKGINPCMLTINAGSNKGVRTGAAATIMSAPNSPVDSAVVDQVFQNLAKVRPLGNSCAKIPANGATVVIQAQ